MATTIPPVLEALWKAIQVEEQGYQFYQMTAERTGDPKAREVFKQMAQEELRHKAFLASRYRSYEKNGTMEPLSTQERDSLALDSFGQIFSEEFRQRIAGRNVEIAALGIGILLEKNAFTFYEEAATRASDPTLKKLFEELAAWEKQHYQVLLDEESTIKEDYWTDAGFWPF